GFEVVLEHRLAISLGSRLLTPPCPLPPLISELLQLDLYLRWNAEAAVPPPCRPVHLGRHPRGRLQIAVSFRPLQLPGQLLPLFRSQLERLPLAAAAHPTVRDALAEQVVQNAQRRNHPSREEVRNAEQELDQVTLGGYGTTMSPQDLVPQPA